MADRHSDSQSDDDLQHKDRKAGPQGMPALLFPRQDTDQDDGEGVCHRVVASGFQLQHRPKVLSKVQFLASKD